MSALTVYPLSNMGLSMSDREDVVEYVSALLESFHGGWQSITITPPVKSGDSSARTVTIAWLDGIEMLAYSDEQPTISKDHTLAG